MKRASAALLAATLAVPMLLAGCSGDSKTDVSQSRATTSAPTPTAAPPTTSDSPSPADTATPTAAKRKTDPNIPAAARVHNPKGGLAFTRYFIERWNVAWSQPRAGILAPLCHPSSDTCAVYEKTSARLVRQGRRLDGDPFTIKSIKILDDHNARRLELLAIMEQEPRNEIDRTGKVHRTEKRKTLPARFILIDDGRGWALSYIDFLG